MEQGTTDALRVTAAGAGFNLGAAIINLSNPAGTIAGYTKDLYGWLERSGVDETNFARCMTAAKGLAYPNKNGLALPESIARADDRLHKLKQGQLLLGITFSQALGRLIVKDPDVCYMATTTACLLTDHDPSYVKSALTAMLLDRGGHEAEIKYTHEVWRGPIRAVISKIVDSIFLNISNSGHRTVALPPELSCLHVHPVDDSNFAAIVIQIQKLTSSLVLRADRFPGDIILWLLNHFEGRIEIYIRSNRIFQVELGVQARQLTIIIKDYCSNDHRTCTGRAWPLELGEVMDGQTRRLVNGFTAEDLRSCSYQRQELYRTRDLRSTVYTSSKGFLSPDLQNEIKHVARRITKWMLQVRTNIKDWPQLAGFCFKTELEGDEDRDRSQDVTIGHYLFRSPRILQENTGESTDTAPIFRRPDWKGSPLSSQNTESDQWGFKTTMEEVLKNFPSAEGLLKNLLKACKCQNCRSQGTLSGSKRGCLRHLGAIELCILISHAVADALGAVDVSGAPNPEDAMSVVKCLLSEIIDEEMVRWDTWFQVAACTITGCPWTSFQDSGGDPEDDSQGSWVAVQFGSLAVMASWLNFNTPPEIKGAFRVETFEGAIQGIKNDLALIQTEHVTDREVNSSRKALGEEIWVKLTETDKTPFEIQKALFPGEFNLHRLLVIAKVDSSLRLFDPTQAMMTLSRSLQPLCRHHPSIERIQEQVESLNPVPSIDIQTIKDMVCGNAYDLNDRKGSTHRRDLISLTTSLVLDDMQKFHIWLALSTGGVVLCDSQKCCLTCAIKRCNDSLTEDVCYRSVVSFDRSSRKQIK